MNKFNSLIVWLMLVGFVGLGIFISFYAFIFMLPVLLLIMGGYFIYVFVKTFMLKQKLKKDGYEVEFYEKTESKTKVIDAEYEILDEKNR